MRPSALTWGSFVLTAGTINSLTNPFSIDASLSAPVVRSSVARTTVKHLKLSCLILLSPSALLLDGLGLPPGVLGGARVGGSIGFPSSSSKSSSNTASSSDDSSPEFCLRTWTISGTIRVKSRSSVPFISTSRHFGMSDSGRAWCWSISRMSSNILRRPISSP